MRIYDPRIGKFLSVDPLTKDYPELTPYQFASNRPVDGTDLDGLEYSPAGKQSGRDNTAVMKYPNSPQIIIESIGKARVAAMQQRRIEEAQVARQQQQEALQKNQTSLAAKQPFIGNVAQKVEFELYKEAKFRDAGFNADGSQSILQKLSANKAWTGLNENIVEPMVIGAAFEGTGKFIGKGITNYFGKSVVAETQEMTVYRVFGGDARAEGFSWTTTHPNSVSNFRNLAGLPSGGASGATNTAEFMLEGRVNISNIIKSRSALPLDGNVGGLPEFIIDPQKIKLIDFKVLKP